jgi:hypothetical protein
MEKIRKNVELFYYLPNHYAMSKWYTKNIQNILDKIEEIYIINKDDTNYIEILCEEIRCGSKPKELGFKFNNLYTDIQTKNLEYIDIDKDKLIEKLVTLNNSKYNKLIHNPLVFTCVTVPLAIVTSPITVPLTFVFLYLYNRSYISTTWIS